MQVTGSTGTSWVGAPVGVDTLPLRSAIRNGLATLGVTSRDDSRPVSPHELHGEPDGEPTQLPSGIMVYTRQLNGRRVSSQEFIEAVRGISLLPKVDQQAIAAAGVPVYLVPSAALEDSLLGATTIVQDRTDSGWRPTLVRVAVSAGRSGPEATREIVQHELGHVLAVLTGQDRSEAAAEAYAARH